MPGGDGSGARGEAPDAADGSDDSRGNRDDGAGGGGGEEGPSSAGVVRRRQRLRPDDDGPPPPLPSSQSAPHPRRPPSSWRVPGSSATMGNGTSNKSKLEQYRHFLHRNQTTLHLLEDVLSRLVLYAPSRFSGSRVSSQVSPEVLYATLNLWTFANDVVLYGTGDGTGMTVGLADELAEELSEATPPRGDDPGAGGRGRHLGGRALGREATLREEWGEVSAVPSYCSGGNGIGLRDFVTGIFQPLTSTNSGVDDLNPAQLVTGLRTALSAVECLAPALEVLSGTTTDVTRRGVAQAQYRRMSTVTRLERIKFWCRMGTLAINYWAEYRRLALASSTSDADEDAAEVPAPCASILSQGGDLHPGERSVSTEEEVERMRREAYVGRRTGRRVRVGGSAQQHHGRHERQQQHHERQQRRVTIGPKSRLAALLLGEVLHAYRPLYWTASERHHARHELDGIAGSGAASGRSPTLELLKAWVCSLAMDILSRRLTLLGATGAVNQHADATTDATDAAGSSSLLPESTSEELRRRKLRWMLYLLRSPLWDGLTRPVASRVSDWVGRLVPLLGRPMANYVMELMVYWQRNHFMLEG